jgi:hypothetical protein
MLREDATRLRAGAALRALVLRALLLRVEGVVSISLATRATVRLEGRISWIERTILRPTVFTEVRDLLGMLRDLEELLLDLEKDLRAAI